jgi:hypothetical protein
MSCAAGRVCCRIFSPRLGEGAGKPTKERSGSDFVLAVFLSKRCGPAAALGIIPPAID